MKIFAYPSWGGDLIRHLPGAGGTTVEGFNVPPAQHEYPRAAFSSEKQVYHAACQLMAPKRIAQLRGRYGLFGNVYQVGQIIKAGQ